MEPPQQPEEMALWRVYVLTPPAPREKKRTVRIYRVGASSREQAIERVRAQIIVEQECRNHKIVAASRFCAVDAALYDGMISLTPAELAARGHDKEDL